jgi:hypothetical protein
MTNTSNKPENTSEKTLLLPFNEYAVHYYSQSSAAWEAAYIVCFQHCNETENRPAGRIVFTYPNGSILPGQENQKPTDSPTTILAGQCNHIETDSSGKPYFVLYYDISRFNDIVNLLRYAVTDDCNKFKESVFISADPVNHVWAICNNHRPQTGAQYKV